MVDISHLELGKHLRVSDLKLGDKVKVLDEPEIVIAHVVLPRAEVAAEAAAVEACPPRRGRGRARGHQEGQARGRRRGRGRGETREG